jgi:hypothetical protein
MTPYEQGFVSVLEKLGAARTGDMTLDALLSGEPKNVGTVIGGAAGLALPYAYALRRGAGFGIPAPWLPLLTGGAGALAGRGIGSLMEEE